MSDAMTYYGERQYDWVTPGSHRTPRDYPYSHDEYFIWRDFDHGDTTAEAYYTDRMRGWDGDKYRKATEGRMTNFHSVPKSKADAHAVVRDYFGPDFTCIGVAQSMNVSNGYPLGVFFVRRAKKDGDHE